MSKIEMKVLIIGIPYFAKKIANNLQAYNDNIAFISLDTSNKIVDKIRYIYHIFGATTIYQIGGSSYLGGALGLANLFKKRIVLHWVGTDVLKAEEKIKTQKANKAFLEYAEHLSEVEWIKAELNKLGIKSKQVQIACIDLPDSSEISFPNEFSILTYMTPGREDFYGLKKIVALAERFPEVKIKIVGISAYNSKLPKNIEIKGWVSDMKKEYLNCSLFLRLPEHDGLAFSVLEALSFGRYVGYSYPIEGAEFITDFNSLENLVINLRKRHSLNNIKLNLKGINFIKNNFQKESVLRELKNNLIKTKN